jgi:hypothetical protein
LRTRFGEHRRAVIGNDANQPVFFKSRNHSVSDIEIRALCPISGSNASRKTWNAPHFQIWHCPLPWHQWTFFQCLTLPVFACPKQTLTVLLILTLFHTCFIYFVVFCVFCIFVLNIFCNAFTFFYTSFWLNPSDWFIFVTWSILYSSYSNSRRRAFAQNIEILLIYF